MTLGVREAVVALIVVLAGYMLFVLLRMRRLNAVRNAGGESEPGAEPGREPALPEIDSAPALTLDELLRQPPEPGPAVRRERSRPRDVADEGARPAGVSRLELERELESLRRDLASVRGEMQELRQDMQQELAQLRAGQSVSPLYSDAMQMAMAGYSAQMIAERCGIARAEAEMVVGLARSQQGGVAHG
ncbi:DUF2802 domain-containing protein [Dechloromonas sp. ZY10]|uniref:DUF2802 domain-containing protein n=1 Tax=Dechloromonas aquae TaxID=2664436 RepID=UPI00352762B6